MQEKFTIKDKKIFKIEAITSPITKRTNLTQFNIRPIDDNLFYYEFDNKDDLGLSLDCDFIYQNDDDMSFVLIPKIKRYLLFLE